MQHDRRSLGGSAGDLREAVPQAWIRALRVRTNCESLRNLVTRFMDTRMTESMSESERMKAVFMKNTNLDFSCINITLRALRAVDRRQPGRAAP